MVVPGVPLKFHKAEVAFFVFMALLALAAAVLIGSLYRDDMIASGGVLGQILRYWPDLKSSVLFSCILLAADVFFGIFFIYPQIRTTAQEEVKLRAMTESLSARSVTLEQAALTDSLTGMQNRRYFDDALTEYIDEFRKIDKPIGMMILDLDHFKSVNDTHGHDVGDEVLRSVANCLKDFTRYHDVVARLGGEEFAVVVPNMDQEHLWKFAERIRKAVSGLVINTENVRLKVTTSVGLAIWDGRETPDEFYRRADKMLYRAKQLGRNRVCA